MVLWWQKAKCSITLYEEQRKEQCCSVGRNADFLQLQIVVEQKSLFFAPETISWAFIFSPQVMCVKTLPKSQCNTHTCIHSCKEVRWDETTWCPCLHLCSGKQSVVWHAGLATLGLEVWWVMGWSNAAVSKLDRLEWTGVISWVLVSPEWASREWGI